MTTQTKTIDDASGGEVKGAVIYCQVNIGEQAQMGYSLQTQIEACRKYAALHGLTVTEDHVITDVYTGAKINQPGLNRVRALTGGREVDAVIVYTLDRLSRNLAHSLVLCEEWQQIGIELHYVSR